MEKTQIDKLREELIKLREERSTIILEKGLAAQENKDLRENSAYDYWMEKEMNITSRIQNIIKIIDDLSKKKKPTNNLTKNSSKRVEGDFEPHNWL